MTQEVRARKEAEQALLQHRHGRPGERRNGNGNGNGAHGEAVAEPGEPVPQRPRR